MNPTRAFVGLGANLGGAREAMARAVRGLSAAPGVRVAGVSPLYRSAPVDAVGPDFLNAVCAVDTMLAPQVLLALLQSLEAQAGRERPHRNAPRTLDLDLLLHGDAAIEAPDLVVPHPRMHLRAFVLRPLLDLARDVELPGRGLARDWLDRAADQALACIADAGWVDASGVSPTPAPDDTRLRSS